MMEGTHEKAARKEREASPEVVAERSPTRCPYCHDACGPEDERARVCQQCLSRHHAACWGEAGQCASCGSTKVLAPIARQVAVTPKELELLRRGLPQDAIERVTRRAQVSDAEAARVLLDAASQELVKTTRGLSAGTLVALVALVGFFLWMIVVTTS